MNSQPKKLRMANKDRTTGWVFSEHYLWHDTGTYNLLAMPSLTVQPGEHAENEATKRRFANLMEVSSLSELLVRLKPRLATEEELLLVHSHAHLDHLKNLCASGGGEAGGATPVGPSSYHIAKLAVGGVIVGVDAVLNGDVDNVYVLCRPPGHHAEQELATGFCLLANGAIGVRYARKKYGLKRIAVVDYDVHHGNSCETIFYNDPDTLTISIHQNNLFPPSRGATTEIGVAAGQGANINVPLPPGSGREAYREAFRHVVLPSLYRFQPEIIFVASGFDASAMDPLAHMMLSSSDFRDITASLLSVSSELCSGRLVFTHEGGYSSSHVPYCGLAVLEMLSGKRTNIIDPFEAHIKLYGGQSLQPHQSEVIQEVVRLHRLQ